MTKYQSLIPKYFEGIIEGKNTHLLLLKNEGGMQVLLTDYGARIVSILNPNSYKKSGTSWAFGVGADISSLRVDRSVSSKY